MAPNEVNVQCTDVWIPHCGLFLGVPVPLVDTAGTMETPLEKFLGLRPLLHHHEPRMTQLQKQSAVAHKNDAQRIWCMNAREPKQA